MQSSFKCFRRPFRTDFLLPRYQTLRVWLISGCAFGTIRRQIKPHHGGVSELVRLFNLAFKSAAALSVSAFASAFARARSPKGFACVSPVLSIASFNVLKCDSMAIAATINNTIQTAMRRRAAFANKNGNTSAVFSPQCGQSTTMPA